MKRFVLNLSVALTITIAGVWYCTWRDRPEQYDAPSSFTLSGTTWKRGTVGRAKDGDTIVVDGLTIRLAGIDAPESKQPFGEAATGYLATACVGREVFVEVLGEDRYRRQLGVVYLLDRPASLNAEMVHAGLAWRYHAEKSEWLKELEDSSRKRRAGLWSDEYPIAPWDWRKGARNTKGSGE